MDTEEEVDSSFIGKLTILLILVSGVIGGLLVVISIMLFIKYCVRKREENE